jgi:hypothetical protein
VITQRSFTLAEKQDALRQILESETFARSEQLRSFLQYVCEMELAGKGAEINEYAIGVDVLHRPKGYSPGSDSSVRSRAYELRQRLARYYEKEAPDAPLRIELPKGSYQPMFVDTAAAPLHTAPDTGETRPIPTGLGRRLRLIVAAFFAGTLLVVAGWGVWLRFQAPAGVDSVVREAWGPLAQSSGNVLVLIGSTLHMAVRPLWQETPGGAPRFDALPELYSSFTKQRPLKPNVNLYMHPTENSLDFGEMKAVVTASNTLRSLGVAYQILPERAVSIAALRGRNTILFGNSQISNIANEEMLRGVWTIDFEPTLGRVAIVDQKAVGRPAPFLGEYGKPGEPTWCCGLVTVLPAEGSANRARTVIISGITPTGTEAAMEYFSSGQALRDLRQRFSREGSAGFPAAYQVVVKCRSKDTFLLASEYAAHKVIMR